MNFYIDFEATQYSQYIISIGCTSETGQSFKTLVKPVKKEKITNFITSLTGITNEMLETAPTADEAFINLGNWINEINGGPIGRHTFYCYGNADSVFLGRTAKHLNSFNALGVATAIKFNLIDYAPYVFDCLNTEAVSLRKVYALIKDKELEITHDALEDAQMLMFVKNNLSVEDIDFDKLKEITIPKVPTPSKKAPKIFLEWLEVPCKWNADTRAAAGVEVRCTDGKNVKEFDTLETAALWCIRYCGAHGSPKKPDCVKKVIKNLISSSKTGKCIYKLNWEIIRKED